MVLFHRPEEAAQHDAAGLDVGFVDIDRLEAPRQRRILLDVLAVFRPGRGGDGAQRSARQRGLQQVGGVAGAGRAAGADQGMGLVDEQDDRGRRTLHLVDHRAQSLLELAFHGCAGLHQADVERAEPDVLSGGGTSPAAMRWANPSTTAVLPTPASPVRIGLFCRRRISTSISWRISLSRPRIGIHLARFRLRGEVLRIAVERGRALRAGGLVGARRARRRAAPNRPSAAGFLPPSPPRSRGARPASASTLILANSCEMLFSARRISFDFSPADQDVAGADLGLAEKQRRVMPAAVEHIDHASWRRRAYRSRSCESR